MLMYRFLIFLIDFCILSYGTYSQNEKNSRNIVLEIYKIDNIVNTTTLGFIKKYVNKKRFIFLGESSHYVNDFNILKFTLIKYLHEECGYNVVLFESGVWNCGFTNLIKDSLSGMRMLVHSLHGIWRVKNNCELMNYIRDNQMNYAGIDPNDNALPLTYTQYNWLFEDDSLSKLLADTDSLFLFQFSMEKSNAFANHSALDKLKIDSIKDILYSKYEQIYSIIRSKNYIKNIHKSVIFQAIKMKTICLNTSNDIESPFYFITERIRDSLMAVNLQYFADSVFPNEKIIVWAHNLHIAKKEVYPNYETSVYRFLSKTIKQSSFVVGIFASSGEERMILDGTNKIKCKKNSLESRYKPIDSKAIFLNTMVIGNRSLRSGLPSHKNVISEIYDAAIIIKDVDGSVLIKYNKDFLCE